MLDAIKPLLDSDLINEDTRNAIQEAWEGKLNETRESIRAELREEFAHRYEHDKTVMVEALDRMVTEGLQSELAAIQNEKRQLAEDRVAFQVKMQENSQKFNNFMVSKLAEEIKDLRQDRQAHTGALVKLESFVVKALAQEITEFSQDKRDLVETKVKLVAEARETLENLKSRFIRESAAKMSATVSSHLKSELKQLHEDIRSARENNFGRRIFEAFATEFSATHLNEKAEVRKLLSLIAKKDSQLAEAVTKVQQAETLVEQKDREVRVIRESNIREKTMEELLGTLNEEKAAVMRELLESVQTNRLKAAFEKYLPAVLNEGLTKTAKKSVITESVVEVTGDKSAKVAVEDTSNIIDLKKLAGL